MTPLLAACHSKAKPEVIKLLLDAGADVNCRGGPNYRGLTPLLAACHNAASTEVLGLLLRAGADAQCRRMEPDIFGSLQRIGNNACN